MSRRAAEERPRVANPEELRTWSDARLSYQEQRAREAVELLATEAKRHEVALASITAYFKELNSELCRRADTHTADEQCTVQDGGCIICGVTHSAPCDECGGRGYHRAGCSEIEPLTDMDGCTYDAGGPND